MFTESAPFYDQLYHWKDYKREAAIIMEWVAKEAPQARTALDVACGTGEHHPHLPFVKIDGLDSNEEFLKVARRKNPAGTYTKGDMTDFDLGRRYDVVLCLFSSIAYAHPSRMLVRTLSCMSRHLDEAGVMLIEPWFPPDDYFPGLPSMQTIDEQDLKVCRMSNSRVEGGCSILQFDYQVNKPNSLKHFEEVHKLGLYTRAEMLKAFKMAGLRVRYEVEGPCGRGLYVARRFPLAVAEPSEEAEAPAV